MALTETRIKAARPREKRLKLADELWQLGQFHTSRALAQEVLEQEVK